MERRTRSILVGTAMAVLAVGGATAVASVADRDDPPEAEAVLRFSPDMAEDEPGGLLGGDPTGEAVPATRFELLTGGLGSLRDYAGTPVVVNFFGSWCEPCEKEMPDFQAVHESLGERVAFLGLAVRDSARDARAFAERFEVTYDLGRDPSGAMLQAFDAVRMPSTFFVSSEGRIVAGHAGELTAGKLRSLIAEHLGVDSRGAVG